MFDRGEASHEEQSNEMAHGVEFEEGEEVGRLDDDSGFRFEEEKNEIECAVEEAEEDVGVEREGGDAVGSWGGGGGRSRSSRGGGSFRVLCCCCCCCRL